MEEEAEKLKEMQGEVEKQMMSTKTSTVLCSFMLADYNLSKCEPLEVVCFHFTVVQIIFPHLRRSRRQMQDQYMLEV